MDRLTGEISIWRNLERRVRPRTSPREPRPHSGPDREAGHDPEFREDERNSLLDEFAKRQGEIAAASLSGTRRRLVVQIDRAEGFMPRSEQIPGEQFHAGDRVRCLILDVRDAGNQVKIVLSRGNPEFIRRLFEAEVPEVAERVIEIKAMSREPVSEPSSRPDRLQGRRRGACVGVRGSRIRASSTSWREKIDIVRWNESSQILIANALKPAEVEEVSLCFELGRATIIVRDDQLSLAIGRRGQNVRLAARLTGWDIDILTPVEFQKGLDNLENTIRPIEGITDEMLDKMGALGMISVFDVEEIGEEALQAELEMSPELAATVVEASSLRAKEVAEEQERERELEEQRRLEEEAAASSLLDGGGDLEGDSRAAAILGGGPVDSGEGTENTGDGAGRRCRFRDVGRRPGHRCSGFD